MVCLPTQKNLRPLADRIRYVLLHLGDRLAVDQGADLAVRIAARANLQCGGRRRQLGSELVIDPVLYEQSIRADTGLACIPELGNDRALHRSVDVRIIEHDKRRITAKFHRCLLHGARTLRKQDLSDLCGPREAELAHQWV
ncbi:hypothetical protein D3C86_1600500 [compost metagenome]